MKAHKNLKSHSGWQDVFLSDTPRCGDPQEHPGKGKPLDPICRTVDTVARDYFSITNTLLS